MKTKISITILLSILLGIFSLSSVLAQPPIKVRLGQTELMLNQMPVTKNNSVLVPVRDIAEILGAKVNWDNRNKTATVVQSKMSIEFTVGKDVAYIHRQDDFTGIPEKCRLTAPAMTVNKTTFVPVRFMAERLGYEVGWENDTCTVVIKEGSFESPKDGFINFTAISPDVLKSSEKLEKWYEANVTGNGVYFINDGKTVYILAGAGMKPTGGYSVSINKIELSENQAAVVEAFVTGPSPDEMVTQAVTYPCALVRVEGTAISTVEGIVTDMTADGTDTGDAKDNAK